MKWPVGPIAVTTALTSLPGPVGTSGLLLGVALFNNSQYLLRVGTVGEWLQPFSAGWYGPDAMSNNSLPVVASPFGNQVNVSDGQILTGMFYSSDEAKPDLLPFSADPITAAEALAATGVPNVLLTTQLFNGNLTPTQVGNPLTVGSYASLVITTHDTSTQSPGVRTALQLDWFPSIDANGVPQGQPYTEYLTSVAGIQINPSWAVPVNFPVLRLTNPRPLAGGKTITVQVTGSNRPVARPTQLGNSYAIRQFKLTAATAANVPVVLANSDGGPDATQLTGQCYVRASVSGASGFLAGLRWVEPGTDALTETYFTPAIAAGGAYTGMIAHPLAVCQVVALPITAFGQTSFVVELTQA